MATPTMACAVCDVRPSEGPIVLRRLNPKGVSGVWLCDRCIAESPLIRDHAAQAVADERERCLAIVDDYYAPDNSYANEMRAALRGPA